MNSVVVDVKLNEEDVVEFQKAHYSRRIKPAMRYTIIIIVAVLFVFNVVLDIISGNLFSLTAALLGLILIFLLATPLMFRLTAKKGLKSNESLMAEHRYVFTKTSVATVSEQGNLDTKWDEMHELRELKNHFLFYIGNNKAFMVPKKCFADEAQMDFVRNCAKAIPIPKKPFNLLFVTMGVTLAIIVILFIIIVLMEVL